ncbi:MAG: hypothetical protein QOF81_2342 [Acidimicrobiaceae bacterium]|nr:hypothetical protein [Acidimicrobiaceae bacterium]
MRDGQKVETRRDRKALASHAGMGRVSVISVLAGALCGLATLEILLAIAGAIGVGLNGGTSFAAMGERQFKSITGVVLVVALFCSFMLGGYVSGRMSRRSGATHGLLAGVTGVVLGVLAVASVIRTGADNGLARVAHHIQVVDTWAQWRTFGLIAALVAAVAMVLGGLTGGVEGERWHGKLLSRAVDPSYGPEAQEQAAARKSLNEAEAARLAAANRVGRVTGAAKSTTATPRSTPVAGGTTRLPSRSTATRTDQERVDETRVASVDPKLADSGRLDSETDPGTRSRKPRHLLGRR